MLRKFLCYGLVIVAVVLAVLGLTLPREQLRWIMYVMNFVDMMIPFLAVSALLNYILKDSDCCK